jgi:hypothetical protein
MNRHENRLANNSNVNDASTILHPRLAPSVSLSQGVPRMREFSLHKSAVHYRAVLIARHISERAQYFSLAGVIKKSFLRIISRVVREVGLTGGLFRPIDRRFNPPRALTRQF